MEGLAFVEHQKDKANELTEENKVFNTNTKTCLQKLIWPSALFRFNTGNRACLKQFKRARDLNSVLLNEKGGFGFFFFFYHNMRKGTVFLPHNSK